MPWSLFAAAEDAATAMTLVFRRNLTDKCINSNNFFECCGQATITKRPSKSVGDLNWPSI